MEVPSLIWEISLLKKKGVENFCELLTEVFVKKWPTEKELEMSNIPWFSVHEGIFKAWGN